jgi:hypothetical protein
VAVSHSVWQPRQSRAWCLLACHPESGVRATHSDGMQHGAGSCWANAPLGFTCALESHSVCNCTVFVCCNSETRLLWWSLVQSWLLCIHLCADACAQTLEQAYAKTVLQQACAKTVLRQAVTHQVPAHTASPGPNTPVTESCEQKHTHTHSMALRPASSTHNCPQHPQQQSVSCCGCESDHPLPVTCLQHT